MYELNINKWVIEKSELICIALHLAQWADHLQAPFYRLLILDLDFSTDDLSVLWTIVYTGMK